MTKLRMRLHVATPCTADVREELSLVATDTWHCKQCNKSVHDLRQATELHARAVVAIFGNELCGRLRVDAEGEAVFRTPRTLSTRGTGGLRRDWAAATMSTVLATSAAACGGAPSRASTCSATTPAVNVAPAVSGAQSAPATTTPGEPLPDADHDGVPDRDDACPNNAETLDGVDDDDGCPEMRPMDGGLAAAPEHIYFQRNSRSLARDYATLLDEVTNVLRSRQDFTELQIVGHADSSERNAAALAAQRSEVVIAELVARGVAPSRLVVSSAVLDEGNIARRVEFSVDE